MSVISEYLKLIPKAIPNATEIVSALKNEVYLKYDKLPEDQKNEIIRRRVICSTCPFMSKNAIQNDKEYYKLFNKKFETDRTDSFCGICGCNIKTRTSGLSAECGISTWNKDNPTKRLLLKWNKYEN